MALASAGPWLGGDGLCPCPGAVALKESKTLHFDLDTKKPHFTRILVFCKVVTFFLQQHCTFAATLQLGYSQSRCRCHSASRSLCASRSSRFVHLHINCSWSAATARTASFQRMFNVATARHQRAGENRTTRTLTTSLSRMRMTMSIRARLSCKCPPRRRPMCQFPGAASPSSINWRPATRQAVARQAAARRATPTWIQCLVLPVHLLLWQRSAIGEVSIRARAAKEVAQDGYLMCVSWPPLSISAIFPYSCQRATAPALIRANASRR